jgi:hypothetical protein
VAPSRHFAAESARRLVAHGKPALRSRSRPTLLRPPQPAPTFAEGVVRTRGIKYNWFNVVLSFFAMGLTLYLLSSFSFEGAVLLHAR